MCDYTALSDSRRCAASRRCATSGRAPRLAASDLRLLRDLIHAAALEGNVCALLAAKDHVNLFLYDGGVVPEPEGIITAGHENKTARMIAFYRGDTINAPA